MCKKIIAQSYSTLNHKINWSWNQNILVRRSENGMVWFDFKKRGQVSSAILATCKVMKNNIRNKFR